MLSVEHIFLLKIQVHILCFLFLWSLPAPSQTNVRHFLSVPGGQFAPLLLSPKAKYFTNFGNILSFGIFLVLTVCYVYDLLCLCHSVNIRVFHENMFLMKKIGSTCSASNWRLVWRNPKGFLILTSVRGCTSHFRFDLFYIVDFYSAVTLSGKVRAEWKSTM